MGSGRYSTDVYTRSVGATLAAGGDTFAHSTRTKALAQDQWKVHDLLDPKTVAGPGSPVEGQIMREARDSDEHPLSVPIVVMFDVTGSMLHLPGIIQRRLPELLETIQLKGYVEDPQILVGGVGDATSDRVPLQVGQFESDNRIDEQIGNIFLEGNGGGQNTESYELAMYYIARHTVTDAFEKRGQKGYLIMIGDEHPYPNVKAAEVHRYIGDELTENITTAAIVAELLEKWDVTFVIPGGSSNFGSKDLEDKWRGYFGQNVVLLDDTETIVDTICTAVGNAEQARADAADAATDVAPV